jgi:hypothetical protein
MSPTRGIYTYSQLQRELNIKIHGRRANLTSGESGDTNVERDLINSAVRTVISEVDLRGSQRTAVLSPNLANYQYDYVLPEDVKGDNIISLQPQNTDCRGEFETFDIVTDDEFDRRKNVERGIATITNDELTRVLRISADVDNKSAQVSNFEDTNWKTFGASSVTDSDIKLDEDDYIEGNGSIRFQTTTDTTDSVVGIQNTLITAFDISKYLARGQAFVDAKLTVADTGIHQISLRIGSDSNNYYQINDSNQNDCTPFEAGWNKIRFDFQNKTKVGTPTDTAIDYVALFWSRDTTTATLLHSNDTDWGFDNLILKRGKYYNLSYYSRYLWQDTLYALAENSTHDSHALMVQNDELELIMTKAAEQASIYLRDYEDAKYYSQEYQRQKNNYLQSNPSEAMVLTSHRYTFGSLETPISDSGSDT